MTVAARDILGVAHKVCEMQCEAGFRSAISRAYYSAYHGCLEWEKSFPAPGSPVGTAGGVHQQLINRLRNPAHEMKDNELRTLSRRVAIFIDILRTKRKAADYLLSAERHEAGDAANSCAQATEVLQRIGALEETAVEAVTADVTPTEASKPDNDSPPPAPPASGRPHLRRIT